jgi:expansin (peptidoglycan-binding protein)
VEAAPSGQAGAATPDEAPDDSPGGGGGIDVQPDSPDAEGVGGTPVGPHDEGLGGVPVGTGGAGVGGTAVGTGGQSVEDPDPPTTPEEDPFEDPEDMDAGVPPPDDPVTTCSGEWGGYSDGTITWYTFSQGTAAIGDVNCSFGISQNPDRVNHVATGDGEYFAAINTSDYDAAATCGACVRVTRHDTGQTITATVVDHCPVASNPKCVAGHVDLSQAAFAALGPVSDGYVGAAAGLGRISWAYVPCPTTETVSFRLKEPSNTYWNEVIVEGHAYPIQSVQVLVGGTWVNATRQEYNFWQTPDGSMGTSPYRVRATDINENVVEGSVALTGGSQPSGQQFACQ